MTSLKEYFALAGGSFTKDDAQVIGPALDDLRSQHDGIVTGETILEVAHSSNHPLHPYFEWDDKKAAHQHRLGQAQQMVREIRVRISDHAAPQTNTRVFRFEPRHQVADTSTTLAAFGGEGAVATQKLEDALHDLEIWRQKYEPFFSRWNKISETVATLIATVDECLDGTSADGLATQIAVALQAILLWRTEHLKAFTPWLDARGSGIAMVGAIEDVERELGKSQVAGFKRDALPDVPQTRKCLRCSREFKSSHVGNRMCETCSSYAAAF